MNPLLQDALMTSSASWISLTTSLPAGVTSCSNSTKSKEYSTNASE